VTTTLGDRLKGTVVSIGPDGKLHLIGPEFESEAVIRGGAIENVVLRGGEKETGAHQVVLTNGDAVVGTLAAISPEGVVIDTPAAGRLKIPLKVVRGVAMRREAGGLFQSEDVLLGSDFTTGRAEPWTMHAPQMWTFADGALIGRSPGGTWLYARLEQKEAITLVAKVQAIDGKPFWFDVGLFGDKSDDIGNQVNSSFRSGEAEFREFVGGSPRTLAIRKTQQPFNGGVVRLAYDPATGKSRMWMGDADMGEQAMPVKLASGQYVAFDTGAAVRVEYVRVLRGIVPPSGFDIGLADGPADEGLSVRFKNGDAVSAAGIALADGQVALATAHGDIKCPLESVASIVFAAKGKEEPARGKGDVQVRTVGGCLTLQLDRLTADELVGRSDAYGGAVKLRRGHVQEIRFNLDRPTSGGP
jgi:hypothetical protein